MSALATMDTSVTVSCVLWKATATTSLTFAIEMRTAPLHLVDGNAFAIKVGFHYFSRQNSSFLGDGEEKV